MTAPSLPKSIYTGLWRYGHCQGIAVDQQGGFVYCSFTTALIKLDMTGRVIGTVTGLLGHLGCIDFCEADGRLYGSLEYKNDEIGRNILRKAGHAGEIANAFYIAIFDAEKIDRPDMDACSDGVMTTVYLREVAEDFAAQVNDAGRIVPHRHGCSGIDGVTFGRLPGDPQGPYRLFVAYGVYGDETRTDNDDQVLLCYDTSLWAQYAQPLSQHNMHQSGPDVPERKLFVRTGNTRWGVQNLEYDEASGNFLMAVYRGTKAAFSNYDLFVIDGSTAPADDRLTLLDNGTGEETPGWRYPYGATGLCSLGEGYFYVSKDSRQGEDYDSHLTLCRWDGQTPFTEVQ